MLNWIIRTVEIVILLLFSSTYSFAQEADLVEVDQFGSNPGHLRLLVHSPISLSKDSTALVVVLHGCSQDAKDVSKLTGWNKLADSLGFYVLYPQTRTVNNPGKCFNWFSPKHNQRGKGEVRSIRSQINYMTRMHPINPQKVFVVGLSAGGAMTVAMLACYPEVFNAGACLAGGPYGGAKDIWESGKMMVGANAKSSEDWANMVKAENPEFEGTYPRLVISHGMNDPVVNVFNADELNKQWRGLLELKESADSLDYNFQGQERISRHSWIEKGEEVLIDYRIQDLGHRLLIDPGDELKQGGKTGIFGLDIDFHSTYWIAKDFGLISD